MVVKDLGVEMETFVMNVHCFLFGIRLVFKKELKSTFDFRK